MFVEIMGAKVTAIVETKDLNKMELGKSHGSLTIYELIHHGDDE